MHPNSKHVVRYNFKRLVKAEPLLASHVVSHPKSGETIDFSNPLSVKLLNKAILKSDYGINYWDFPENFLCPPIPGRADYIHHMADLLKKTGPKIRVLDIGVGANCIYPLVGHKIAGWSFVGVDIDETALSNAQKIVNENHLDKAIELRLQKNKKSIFHNVILPGEKFDLTICNPPFFSSLKEAEDESRRKWKHLGIEHKAQHRNFGGLGSELYCQGGEAAFLKLMIEESKKLASQVRWFSSLVSKGGHLKAMDAQLEKAGASEMHIIDMEQGQKKSRAVAWTFL